MSTAPLLAGESQQLSSSPGQRKGGVRLFGVKVGRRFEEHLVCPRHCFDAIAPALV